MKFRGTEDGFALIEVLIGLMILSIALISAMRSIAAGADAERAINIRTAALWSADNAMNMVRMTQIWPDLITTYSPCPQGPYLLVCEQRVSVTPNPAFRRVEIAVFQSNPNAVSTPTGPRLALLVAVVPNHNLRIL
jgi:general secretion pathway protein I